MAISISTTCSGTVDGEAKTISGSVTLDSRVASSGVLTCGTTYEALFNPSVTPIFCAVYNAGSVDVSVRVGTGDGSLAYMFLTCPPGCVIVVPNLLKADAGNIIAPQSIAVKAQAGTAEVEYCIVY